ncbi:1-acyl-sn-glycerol-3-phosphate acyltransferase [Polaribacter sp.]|nr:1-acyl-sn-glycerol-3-phosphate acyltransferase [Polaribacter sp.]
MNLKDLWYLSFKQIIKLGLFFYTRKIHVSGKENIPKKDAVIFVPNHPNGLIDPLYVATNTPRINHFLVRAAVFKKEIVKKILGSLNLMPIYRVRDGKDKMYQNDAIFEKCHQILLKKRALMIFAEGSHDSIRRLRPLKTGFIKIAFGTIQINPKVNIYVVPVGITYQRVTHFPSEIALNYGTPILANDFYDNANEQKATSALDKAVSNQLKQLMVHIPKENYEETLHKLNKANVDFTNVNKVNEMIATKALPIQRRKIKFGFLKTLLVFNNIVPYLIWKKVSKKIADIEFVDTFRFAVGMLLFPLNLVLQTTLVSFVFNGTIGFYYAICSLLLVLIYVKK